MKKWENRPLEIATLLNPAFCGLLLFHSVDGYLKEVESEGAPYALPFITLPLILHKPTRQELPRTTKTTFSSWITKEENLHIKLGFAERAKNLTPYVRESLAFCMYHKHLYLSETGLLLVLNPLKKSFTEASEEIKECIRAAEKCGRLIAKVGNFKTTMALLGVRP